MSPLIGLDYGLRRIGIAVSDDSDTIAIALGTHREGLDGSIVERLRSIVSERACTGVVVGWPVTASGEVGDMARRARSFAEKMERALGLPVVMVDERYSSQEAERSLRLAGRKRRKAERKEEIDAVAAQLILQQHLDAQARQRKDP